MHVCLHMGVCRWIQVLIEIRCPGPGVTWGCEPHNMVLGTELGFSAKAVCTPNCWAVSPAHTGKFHTQMFTPVYYVPCVHYHPFLSLSLSITHLPFTCLTLSLQGLSAVSSHSQSPTSWAATNKLWVPAALPKFPSDLNQRKSWCSIHFSEFNQSCSSLTNAVIIAKWTSGEVSMGKGTFTQARRSKFHSQNPHQNK